MVSLPRSDLRRSRRFAAARLHGGRTPAEAWLLRAFRAGELQRRRGFGLRRLRPPPGLRGRSAERPRSHRRRESVVLPAGDRRVGRYLAASRRAAIRHRGRRHHDPRVAHPRRLGRDRDRLHLGPYRLPPVSPGTRGGRGAARPAPGPDWRGPIGRARRNDGRGTASGGDRHRGWGRGAGRRHAGGHAGRQGGGGRHHGLHHQRCWRLAGACRPPAAAAGVGRTAQCDVLPG